MTIETIITATPILIAAVLLILLACTVERVGYWRQEAKIARDVLREARAEIDDDNVIIAWQRKQIDGHLRDSLYVHNVLVDLRRRNTTLGCACYQARHGRARVTRRAKVTG